MQVSPIYLTPICRPVGSQPASAARKDHKLSVNLLR